MIQSMTGFGKSIVENNNASITVEIRSVNSKSADINLRLPRIFNSKELEIRNTLMKELERGKIGFTLEYTNKTDVFSNASIDEKLLQRYYQLLKKAADSVGENTTELFKIALNMPEVLKMNNKEEENDEDWNLLQKGIKEAISSFNNFRNDEGNSLKNALLNYVTNIATSLEDVKLMIPIRKEAVVKRIKDQLIQLKIEVNEDRFEQELIYYLEKLDITEEVVRLSTHLNYFTDEINSAASGKKLGFISQEIGREINTIGSKANNAEMQKHVVLMKEELEKIKEQVLNVL